MTSESPDLSRRLFHVKVCGTRLTGHDQHAEYEVSVDGKSTCWHRYREFDDLANELRKAGIATKLNLPPKRIFSGNTPQVMNERRIGLEIWLNAVMETMSGKSLKDKGAHILREFLKTDLWEESNGKTNTSLFNAPVTSLSPHDVKLQEIVSRFSLAATTPSPYSSFSRLAMNNNSLKENSAPDDFDLNSFRDSLDRSENIFNILKPAKQ